MVRKPFWNSLTVLRICDVTKIAVSKESTAFSQRSLLVRGFSLIELLAVTAIIVIISSIMLSNTPAFGGTITLRNLTYDVALSIRQAQTYGISVRKFTPTGSTGVFAQGYGVNFQLSSPTTYLIFADVNANGHYTGAAAGVEELVKSFDLNQNFRMVDVCVTPVNGTEQCAVTTGTFDRINIIFIRPEPDARIRIATASTVYPTLYQRARVILQAPRGDKMSVLVEATGQISVQ